MTTLLELSAQMIKVIEIFNRRPELYQREGIGRISPAQRHVDEFMPLLRHRKIDELLASDAAQTDSFAFLLIAALKKDLKEALVLEVSPESILRLTEGLFAENLDDHMISFLAFSKRLAASENINDILAAQIIHDLLHIASNIQSKSEFNRMDAENCGRTFGVSIANFLRIDPSVGLALNGIVRELIRDPQFSKSFSFDERMRVCLERRQTHLSNMTAEMVSQVNLRRSSILDASESLMMKPSPSQLSEKKDKKTTKTKRRHSEAEIRVASSFEQISKLKGVITTLQLEQWALHSLLHGSGSDYESTPPMISPRNPNVIPSPRDLIKAGPGAIRPDSPRSSVPIHIPSPLDVHSQEVQKERRIRSSSYSPHSTPPSVPGLGLLHQLQLHTSSDPNVLAIKPIDKVTAEIEDQKFPQFPPPVFRNINS